MGLTTIDIPEEFRNKKINLGLTWLGVIKSGMNSQQNVFKINELQDENQELKDRIIRLQALLDKYVKLSKEN